MINDGHHKFEALLEAEAVIVTPLKPPYYGRKFRITLDGMEVVFSREDGVKIEAMVKKAVRANLSLAFDALEGDSRRFRLTLSTKRAEDRGGHFWKA